MNPSFDTVQGNIKYLRGIQGWKICSTRRRIIKITVIYHAGFVLINIKIFVCKRTMYETVDTISKILPSNWYHWTMLKTSISVQSNRHPLLRNILRKLVKYTQKIVHRNTVFSRISRCAEKLITRWQEVRVGFNFDQQQLSGQWWKIFHVPAKPLSKLQYKLPTETAKLASLN